MKKQRKEKKQIKFLKFFSISVFIFLLSISPIIVKAEDSSSGSGSIITNILFGAINSILTGILSILTNIAGFLLYLGAQLITILFQTNTQIADAPIVTLGWQIVRDVANLGFVIAFIVIAFMTILRISSYNAQKMLPKLIAAIILVNFSLAIASFILDFTNVLTKFFVDRALGGNADLRTTQDIGSAISATLNPQAFLKTKQSSIAEMAQVETYEKSEDVKLIQNITSLFTIFIFTFFMAFLLLANALMLLTRFAYIAVLITISPIPWLLGVIPINQIKGKMGTWWDKFLEWAFVAPILSFFLYLTLSTARKMKELISYIPLQGDVFTNIDNLWNQIMNTLILGGFLAAGLIASKAMGGKLAASVVGFGVAAANKAKSWAKGIPGKTVSRAGRRLITAGSTRDEKGKSYAEKLGESKIARKPFIGAVFRGIAGASTKAKEKSQEEIEKAKNKYKSLSKDTLKNRIESQLAARGFGAMTESDMAAALALAEKGGWNELSETTRNKLINAMKRFGTVKKLATFDPLAAASTGLMDLEEATGKVENPVSLNPNILKEIAPYLRPEQRRQIGQKGSTKQKEAVVEGLKEAFISSSIKRKDESGKETPEFENEKKNIEKVFDKLEEQKTELNKLIKEYSDAKDRGEPKDVLEKMQKERDIIKENISALQKVLVEGGKWTENLPTGIFDKKGNPVTMVGETIEITPPQIKEGETENKELETRKKAMQVRNDLAKQTIWQGEKLFKPSEKKGEEEY